MQPDDDSGQTWKNVLIVAWTGTRGVISLATALAIPLTLRDGSPFPQRNSIIFLAFIVIFVTLVVQGLSLPLLIRWLGIKPQKQSDREERELMLYLATNTLHFLENQYPEEIDPHVRDQLKRKLPGVSPADLPIQTTNRKNCPTRRNEVPQPLPRGFA